MNARVQDKYKAAMEAIDALYRISTVPAKDVYTALFSIQEEIEIKLEALKMTATDCEEE